MWEDVLAFVDNETNGDDSRLFVQEDAWDGSQYIRFAPFLTKAQTMTKPCVTFVFTTASSNTNTPLVMTLHNLH